MNLSSRTANLITGATGLALGACALAALPWQAGVASIAQATDPAGPGFFPLLAASMALIAGLVMLAQYRLARRDQDAEQVRAAAVLPMVLALAAFCAGMYTIGMLSSMGLLVAYTAWRFHEQRPARLLLLGCATPLAIYLLFEAALQILFPAGWVV